MAFNARPLFLEQAVPPDQRLRLSYLSLCFHQLTQVCVRQKSQPSYFHSFANVCAKQPGVAYPGTQNGITKPKFSTSLSKGTQHIMPHQSTSHKATPPRCAHRFPASGHQCRLLASDLKSGLCAHHLAKKKVLDRDADFFDPLMRQQNRFQSAQDINYSLNELYDLLARDRISARRASTLAYISSLLLRTLPAIDHDYAVGVRQRDPDTCPTHPQSAALEPAPPQPTSDTTPSPQVTPSPEEVFSLEGIPASTKPS
jgi:hypothetical protein